MEEVNFAVAVIEYLQGEFDVAPAVKPMLALPAPAKVCAECVRRREASAARVRRCRERKKEEG